MKKSKKSHKRDFSSKKISPSPIYIGELDRITYVYEIDNKGKCIKIDNVSYEIKVAEVWYLVSRYDSIHGFLHCHMRNSTKDNSEILLDRSPIIKKGEPKDWLTWAIKDFKQNFFEYRKGFLKRSKIPNIY